MKKFSALLLCVMLLLSLAPAALAQEEVLRVYNWQDYINEGKDDDGAKIAESVTELWERITNSVQEKKSVCSMTHLKRTKQCSTHCAQERRATTLYARLTI